ncbi:hypothetical protein K503DRAFT_774744, partial [Rhizopogon vinicolor AM-OR11-026]
MHAIEVNINSEVKLCPASEMIGTLQNIVSAHVVCTSEIIMIDRDCFSWRVYNQSYSNTNLSVIGQDQSIHAVVTEHQQQLDAVLHQIQDLDAVTKTLHQHVVGQYYSVYEPAQETSISSVAFAN